MIAIDNAFPTNKVFNHDRAYFRKNGTSVIMCLYVTGFAKRGLPHSSNLLTLTMSNFRLVNTVDLKFGKQQAPTYDVG